MMEVWGREKACWDPRNLHSQQESNQPSMRHWKVSIMQIKDFTTKALVVGFLFCKNWRCEVLVVCKSYDIRKSSTLYHRQKQEHAVSKDLHQAQQIH